MEWHIEQGSHGLVPVGTTGESPTLSHEEHEIVVSTVVQKVNGRIPVIAGAGSNNTVEALNFMKHAKRLERMLHLSLPLITTSPLRQAL